MLSDEAQDLGIHGGTRLRQILQIAQDRLPLPQIAERQFADDEGMSNDLLRLQQFRQNRVALPEMIDPDGGIRQNHTESVRRRGMG